MNQPHNRTLHRRTFLTVAGASAASAILAACGGASSPTNTAAPTGATAAVKPTISATTAAPSVVGTAVPAAPQAVPTAAAASSVAAANQPTGTLRIAHPNKVLSLDPTGPNSLEGPTLTIGRQIFDQLVVRDPVSGEFKPSLATKWETPDPSTWTFTLRTNATFHDGSPVTSADVKATLDRILLMKGPIAPLWATLDTVETPDPATARMKFKSPIGTVLASAALLNILPAAKLNQDGFFQKPIGSGPFMVSAYKPDAEVTLDANPKYWGGAPRLQTLRFVIIPEVTARLTAIDTGEIDFTWTIPPDQLPKLKQNTNLTVTPTPTYTYYFIWMNAKRPPFTDPRVRQAMAYAVDVDAIVKDLLSGIGTRMNAPIPSTVFGYAPQTPYAYDPKKAQQLLSDAGIKPGTEVDLIWSPTGGPQIQEITDALVSYWNAVGIKVKNDRQEAGVWLDNLIKLNWDMDVQTNSVLTGDADFTLRRLYVSSANRNGYANPALDKLLNDAAGTVDQKQRATMYAQADKIIWDDAVGIFPFELLENYVYNKKVTGFTPVPNLIPSFMNVSVS
ncbi:MAG: ABC transporter substrate-binding protein [Chloroflexota bacterium]|nr:ABC transporter substrate-binding protein [Chloroflexota bacterium]